MALQSVSNSWKDDTRKEKNGRAKWQEINWPRGETETNLFPFLRITGRSQPLSLNGNQLGSAQTPLFGHSKRSEQRKTAAKTPRLLWALKILGCFFLKKNLYKCRVEISNMVSDVSGMSFICIVSVEPRVIPPAEIQLWQTHAKASTRPYLYFVFTLLLFFIQVTHKVFTANSSSGNSSPD